MFTTNHHSIHRPFHRPTQIDGKAILKIILVIVALISALLIFIFMYTQGIANAAKDQLQAIRIGDLAKAYGMTSKAFQDQTSLDEFKAFINHYPILRNNKDIAISQRKVEDGLGYLRGTLEGMDGSKMKIEYQFVKEDSQWKIQAIRLSLAGLITNERSGQSEKNASIYGILISDEAAPNGYVSTEKSTLSKTAAHIYVTVQIITPVRGIIVSATLTHLTSGGKIGPIAGTVSQRGNILKAFSFTRDQHPWPKGEYKVDISLSDGASKSASFKIK